MIECWSVGTLESLIIEVFECGNAEVLEFWSVVVLSCWHLVVWNVKMLNSLIVGALDCWSTGVSELFLVWNDGFFYCLMV